MILNVFLVWYWRDGKGERKEREEDHEEVERKKMKRRRSNKKRWTEATNRYAT